MNYLEKSSTLDIVGNLLYAEKKIWLAFLR